MAEETDWSQLGTGYQGPILPPCKQALGMWFHEPWKMDMQSLCKSALILDYSMHNSDMKQNKHECSEPTSVAMGPTEGAATQLPPPR